MQCHRILVRAIRGLLHPRKNVKTFFVSVAGKHFYRFKYLRSDHWQDLRLRKLVSVDAKCFRCGHRDVSNDVHHLRYRRLFNVRLSDLIVLCRECHELTHEALEFFRGSMDTGARVVKRIADFQAGGGSNRAANQEFKRLRESGLLDMMPREQRIALAQTLRN